MSDSSFPRRSRKIRNVAPAPPRPPPSDVGFFAVGSRITRVNEADKYNPAQVYDASLKAAAGSAEATKEKKQKVKYVNLYGEQGQERLVMRLPGRNECNCQGMMHGLVHNCTKCGRIVCEQEGSGTCFFCGSLVFSREEQKILDQGGRKAEELRQKLLLQPRPKPSGKANDQMQLEDVVPGGESKSTKSKSGNKSSGATPTSAKNSSKGLEKAVAEKDRLLEYQRNSARRTKVFDDESDYFNTSNTWLSDQEREKLRKREEELRGMQNIPRSQRKITLDIAGRQVIEENPMVNLYNPDDVVIQEVYFGGTPIASAERFASLQRDDNHRPGYFRPTFVNGDGNERRVDNPTPMLDSNQETRRLQDGTLEAMSDNGKCLSMHQPHASLLVRGIKKHEGRSWYTSHRGPLWIASTAKQPTKEDIQMVESFYQIYYNTKLPASLPSNYSSGCLLGCVNVVDCLTQEEYRELYPGGESESAYVWICENPKQLSTVLPIRGQHKIYKLEPAIHQAVKKMLVCSDSAK